jgi:predicted RNase H-like nuclease (RuvC/YqgF family)
VLTASVKALARWVRGLEADRDDLRAENERLLTRIERMEAENAALSAAMEALRREVKTIANRQGGRP